MMSLQMAALNMFAALVMGALIGSERQVRRRTAGVRTNALVALAAAGFVVFSAQYIDELSPTRVAAQVVSGIGFLGAGIIFREGFTVHGLNTAATLWCSAAVGVMAGGGHLDFALVLAGLVVFVNLGLRPVVTWIKRKTGALDRSTVQLVVRSDTGSEAEVRSLVLKMVQARELRLIEMTSRSRKKGQLCQLTAMLEVGDRVEKLMDDVVTHLASAPHVTTVRWDVSDD